MKNITEKSAVAWMLTINNPNGEENDPVKLLLNSALKDKLKYVKWALEEGEEEQTPHIHIYAHLKGQQRFSALKKVFPRAHIDELIGTPQQSIDYVGNPDFTYSDTNPDKNKAGKRKGGRCVTGGEWGTVEGISLDRAANAKAGGGKMENRLLAIKEKIDAGCEMKELWDTDFYIVCKNLTALNAYYAAVYGVSILEKIQGKKREAQAEMEKEHREVLDMLRQPLTDWPSDERYPV